MKLNDQFEGREFNVSLIIVIKVIILFKMGSENLEKRVGVFL